MGTLVVGQGAAKSFNLRQPDATGNVFEPVTNPSPFDGTETLRTRIWEGGSLATLFTSTTTWVDPATVTYNVAFAMSDTAALPLGIYYFQTTVTKSGVTGNLNEDMRLQIKAAPGSDVAGLAFTKLPDLLKYCPWLEDLQTPSDEWGFLTEQVRATTSLIDKLVLMFKGGSLSPQIGQPGFNAASLYGSSSVGPSLWLRANLVPLVVGSSVPSQYAGLRNATNANFVDPSISTCLLLYDEVKEICARWAIGYVMDAQIGRNDDKQWQGLAGRMKREADSLFQCRRFEVDLSVPQTGWASITINGGSTNMR